MAKTPKFTRLTDYDSDQAIQNDIIADKDVKNYIINGNMDFAQRAVGPSGVSGYETLDRWYFWGGGTMGQVSVLGERFDNALEITQAASNHNFAQRIESIFTKDLVVGNKLVISCKVKLVSGATFSPELRVETPDVKDDWSASTIVTTSVLDQTDGAVDATFKIFKKDFIITQTMIDNGFGISLGNITGVAGTSTVQYAEVMINKGDVAQDFRTAGRDYIEEGNLCARYYMKSGEGLFNGTDANVRIPHAGSYSQNPVRFPVTMRTQPVDTFRDGAGTLNKISMDNASTNVIANNLNVLFLNAYVDVATWFIIPVNSGYSTIIVQLELDAEL